VANITNFLGGSRISLTNYAQNSTLQSFASANGSNLLNLISAVQSNSPVGLDQALTNATQAVNGVWDQPIYADFFAAVRDVNSRLPADARIRVFGGDPGPGDNRSREVAAVSVIKEQVLQKHGKALVTYGAAHFFRTMPKQYLSSVGEDIGIARILEMNDPGRTFVVIPMGPFDPPPGAVKSVDPDFRKFDRALKTQVRPVLVPLKPPFRGFTAEEFLGRTIFNCRGPGGCVSMFKGSTLTLGQIADAVAYVGGSGDAADTKTKPAR